MSIFLLPEL